MNFADRFSDARTIYNQHGPQTMREVERSLKKMGCSITYSYISTLESGTRNPSLIIAATLAEYYGVSLDWLVGLSDVVRIDDATRNVQDLTGLTESNVSALMNWKADQDKAIKNNETGLTLTDVANRIFGFITQVDTISALVSLNSLRYARKRPSVKIGTILEMKKTLLENDNYTLTRREYIEYNIEKLASAFRDYLYISMGINRNRKPVNIESEEE